MGADIVVHEQGYDSADWRVPRRPLEQVAVITGPTPLHGADVEVPDLRGGFSYLIAALSAEGRSTVSNVGIIARGYERFVEKLRSARRAVHARLMPETADRPRPGGRRPSSGGSSPRSSSRSCCSSARYHIRHPERIPASGAFVFAANHYTNFDPLTTAYVLWKLGRVPRFLAKASLFKVPVFGAILRGTGQIPVERQGSGHNRQPLAAAANLVDDGPRRRHLPGGHAHPRARPLADARQVGRRPHGPRARRAAHPDGALGGAGDPAALLGGS